MGNRVETLRKRYELTEAETAVLLLASAPDLDLRYERVFAYLQDNVRRKRPSPSFGWSRRPTQSRAAAFNHSVLALCWFSR